MIKSQRILIVDKNLSEDEAIALTTDNDCVAVFRGIPNFLLGRATEESWKLPYVFTDSWEEPDPEGEI